MSCLLTRRGRRAVDSGNRFGFDRNTLGFANLANAFQKCWKSIRRHVNALRIRLDALLFNEQLSVAEVDSDLGAVRQDEVIHDARPVLVIEFTVHNTYCRWWADHESLGYLSFGLTDNLSQAREHCKRNFSKFRIVEAIYASE